VEIRDTYIVEMQRNNKEECFALFKELPEALEFSQNLMTDKYNWDSHCKIVLRFIKETQ
jgi:hypothetical protein